jgi:hypothetical protein
MTVHTNAEEVSQEIRTRIATISVENGFETDIGVSVFDGRIAVNDSDVPCASVVEGTDDRARATPGRSALWKMEQGYTLVGYSPGAIRRTRTPKAHASDPRSKARDLQDEQARPTPRSVERCWRSDYKGRNVGRPRRWRRHRDGRRWSIRSDLRREFAVSEICPQAQFSKTLGTLRRNHVLKVRPPFSSGATTYERTRFHRRR